LHHHVEQILPLIHLQHSIPRSSRKLSRYSVAYFSLAQPINSSDSIGLVAWLLSQGFCCIECIIANEEEGLTPISSQVFIYEGMSLCLKHFRIRSSLSGYIPQSILEKVERK